MKLTENYGLKKPDPTDIVNVYDFNYNADIIDSKLKEAEDSLVGLELVASNVKMADGSTVEVSISNINEEITKKADNFGFKGTVLQLKSGDEILSSSDLRELGLTGDASLLASRHTVEQEDWTLDEEQEIYYVSLKHNLGTTSILMSCYDVETNMSVLDTYEVVDENTIKVYSELSSSTCVTIIDGTGNCVDVAQVIIDDEVVTSSNVWSASKTASEIEKKTVDLSHLATKEETSRLATKEEVNELRDLLNTLLEEVRGQRARGIDIANNLLSKL